MRGEAPLNRVEVGDRAPRGAVIRVRVRPAPPFRRSGAVGAGAGSGETTGPGGKQPRQRRDAPALPDGVPEARYNDLGSDFYDKRINTERRKRNHLHQLQARGYKVTLDLPPDSHASPSRLGTLQR